MGAPFSLVFYYTKNKFLFFSFILFPSLKTGKFSLMTRSNNMHKRAACFRTEKTGNACVSQLEKCVASVTTQNSSSSSSRREEDQQSADVLFFFFFFRLFLCVYRCKICISRLMQLIALHRITPSPERLRRLPASQGGGS
jgi:hypothetical protein